MASVLCETLEGGHDAIDLILSRRLIMSAKESKFLLSELPSDPEIRLGVNSMKGLVGPHDSLIDLGRMVSTDREVF